MPAELPGYMRPKEKRKVSDENGGRKAGTSVTTLPSTDLRFLRMRRGNGNDSLVPITFDRDQKLREIFSELDHSNRGFIYLNELKEASEFVQQRMKSSKNMHGEISLYFTYFTSNPLHLVSLTEPQPNLTTIFIQLFSSIVQVGRVFTKCLSTWMQIAMAF